MDARLGRGGLHRLHRGVYLVGHEIAPPFARELAAVLACGAGAVVARRSALALHGIGRTPSGNVQVLIGGRRPRTRTDISVRRCDSLPPSDVTRRHGVPVTTAARAVIDLAGELSVAELEDVVNEVQVLRLASAAAIAAALHRVGPRQGTAALRRMLADADRGVTRSRAERRLLSLIRSAGLPMPETNAPLAGYRVDALWSRQRVVVEVDSWQFHGTRRAFERDRRRDADVLVTGHRVLRVTWRQMEQEPLAVVARLAAVLAADEP